MLNRIIIATAALFVLGTNAMADNWDKRVKPEGWQEVIPPCEIKCDGKVLYQFLTLSENNPAKAIASTGLRCKTLRDEWRKAAATECSKNTAQTVEKE